MADQQAENNVIPLGSSSNGRASGKQWKPLKKATVRSQCSKDQKTKWEERMERNKRGKAIKKLENELKEERRAELQRRREITTERKKAAEERCRLEEEKAKMSARKAARHRRKAGRSKKVKG
ncbi:hypothetical protein F5J12DRAFT_72813 [Pisolithus orientalis]|uniref:uncharacterized protein n=1 Tax=Pisolithus orientalis TaxID=936130 RepID=UPI0022250E3E|nr:uncharacterized protein F5J12DRAFT_72813 [Pisolithus orientalis]KAI6008330.1 hypothetical protein F5J12DRAFT_72813 [Pisolithus orientalis]